MWRQLAKIDNKEWAQRTKAIIQQINQNVNELEQTITNDHNELFTKIDTVDKNASKALEIANKNKKSESAINDWKMRATN